MNSFLQDYINLCYYNFSRENFQSISYGLALDSISVWFLEIENVNG